jgi:hypothetical protein
MDKNPTDAAQTANQKNDSPTNRGYRAMQGQEQRVDEQSQPETAQTRRAARFQRRWLLVGVTVGLVLAGAVALWAVNHFSDPVIDPDLPDWFDQVYRIKQRRGIIFPAKAATAQAKKKARQPGATSPARYTQEWMNENFTHYIEWRNAFVFARPRVVYPSEGKIMAGVKVIVGQQLEKMSLICTVTEDGRPENMFVENWALREKSKGPPPPVDD